MLSRMLLTLALTVAAAPVASAQPSPPEALTPYRAKRLFQGCWTLSRPTRNSRWPSTMTWCFNGGRAISGFDMDGGHGADLCLRWRTGGPWLAVFGNAQDEDGERCRYAFSADRRTLTLQDCPSAGDWKRDDEMSAVRTGCRKDGSFDSDDESDAQP